MRLLQGRETGYGLPVRKAGSLRQEIEDEEYGRTWERVAARKTRGLIRQLQALGHTVTRSEDSTAAMADRADTGAPGKCGPSQSALLADPRCVTGPQRTASTRAAPIRPTLADIKRCPRILTVRG